MNSLLPPGSSALERRLAAACAGITGLNVPLRDLWNPDRCPAQFLPYLAWAFSVDSWEETWSEADKRQAISDAFWLHQRKGTVAAVQRVIERLGYTAELDEWWNTGSEPGTFSLNIDLQNVGISEPMLTELERIIGDAKPVSRHISQLTLSLNRHGTAYVGAAIADGEVIDVYPPGYTPDGSLIYSGRAFYDGNYFYTHAERNANAAIHYDGAAAYDGEYYYGE